MCIRLMEKSIIGSKFEKQFKDGFGDEDNSIWKVLKKILVNQMTNTQMNMWQKKDCQKMFIMCILHQKRRLSKVIKKAQKVQMWLNLGKSDLIDKKKTVFYMSAFGI